MSDEQLYWVQDELLCSSFPPLDKALRDPDGLLAIGHTLSQERLLDAYSKGVFPWFNQKEPVMWWSPDPRCILFPDELSVSKSLAKRIRQKHYFITYDTAFSQVISECALMRKDSGTWITGEMKTAYLNLFDLGYAHSVECWQQDKLVGGLYGIAMGKIFFGESMFSRSPDASKIALFNLCHQLRKKAFQLIDCQVYSKHLESLGAKLIQRNVFANILSQHCNFEKTEFNLTET